MTSSSASKTLEGSGKQRAAVIELVRATPPLIPAIESVLQETFAALQSSLALPGEFQQHRFGGTAEDKEAAARWLGRRLAYTPDSDLVIVTNGMQNTLFLLAAGVVGSGNVLLTESLTYPQIKSLSNLLGVRVVGVPIDTEGVLPDALDFACRTYAPKALYCIPTIHNPTTSVMGNDRRREVVEVARRHRIFIFEDDAQSMLAANSPPPIATFGPDLTWYTMTLSKSTAVGLRVCYLLAPAGNHLEPLMSRFRAMSMWFASPISAAIASRWTRDGTAERVLLAIRDEMASRHAIAANVLKKLPFVASPYALFGWLALPDGMRSREFGAAMADAGILLRAGEQFAVVDSPIPQGMRVSLSARPREELEQGLSILAEAFNRVVA